jgi:hypothetical protein
MLQFYTIMTAGPKSFHMVLEPSSLKSARRYSILDARCSSKDLCIKMTNRDPHSNSTHPVSSYRAMCNAIALFRLASFHMGWTAKLYLPLGSVCSDHVGVQRMTVDAQ